MKPLVKLVLAGAFCTMCGIHTGWALRGVMSEREKERAFSHFLLRHKREEGEE